MNTQQLLDAFGELADDRGAVLADRLWSNGTRLLYANEAQQEAARRARLIEDRDHADICRIAVTAGTQVYAVDARVIQILGAVFVDEDGGRHPLEKVHPKNLDRQLPNWQDTEAQASPSWWAAYATQKICIEKTTVDGVLHLHVLREPAEDMRLASDGPPEVEAVPPEIPSRYHLKLVDWMLYRALNQRDKEEKYDPQSAAAHLALFEAEFGPRSSAIDETWITRHHGYDEYEGLY